MDKELRILIVDDSTADAELVTRELGKVGLAHTSKWVKSKDEFLKALWEYAPDMVLCDYMMPDLGAPMALEIIKKTSQNIPLIVVSGTIGEDVAVDMMRLGATDYVMKDKIFKLAPAVKRAIKENDEYIGRKLAEDETRKRLQELEIFYKASVGREERILELKKKIAELEEKLKK